MMDHHHDGQTNATRLGVICQGASSAHFLLARVQLSICFPTSLSEMCPADCFQDILFQQAGNSHWNKLALHGISPTYQVTYLLRGRMKVPHLMSAMLRASSATMSDALQQTEAAPIGVICKSASSAPHFLLARVQLSICFPTSLSEMCPADCFQDILFQQGGNSHWNELAFRGISPTYQVTYLLISAPWMHESTSLDVNKANGMLTSNAKRDSSNLDCSLC